MSRTPRLLDTGTMRPVCVAAAAAVLATLAACNHESPPAHSSAPQTMTPAASAPISDPQLKGAIERALGRDPVLRPLSVRVTVADGEVTLDGAVPTLAAKQRAADLVSAFRGAEALNSTLRVEAPPRADAEIEKDVSDALARDRATRSARVHASVSNQTVTIRGTADSSAQRELLSEGASQIPGVRQVNLIVDLSPYSSRNDAEIVADVRNRLADDAQLDGSHVAAEVSGRHAVVSGFVGSLAQRNAAVEDAWVAGVANVDARGLHVNWRENERTRVNARFPIPSDDHVAAALRSALASDLRIGTTLPSVSVKHGVATLTGVMEDFRAVRASGQDARRVLGAWRLDDRMTVMGAGTESDSAIQAQVQRSIYNDTAAPDSRNVKVTTANARVQLHGAVASQEEKRMIESDAEEVPGVVAVENDLLVQGYGPQTTATPVASIRDRVVEAVYWDPRVEAGKVSIDVAPSGDVTLTGTVDAWGEARAADDDAIAAGAAHVINHIRIASAPEFSAPTH